MQPFKNLYKWTENMVPDQGREGEEEDIQTAAVELPLPYTMKLLHGDVHCHGVVRLFLTALHWSTFYSGCQHVSLPLLK